MIWDVNKVLFCSVLGVGQVKGGSIETCTEKVQSVKDKLLAAQNAGSPLHGVEVPRCDTDGTYAGMQYIGSK